MNQADIVKVGAVVTSVTVHASKKVGLPDYGSQGAMLELTANVSKDADLDTVTQALSAYCEAYCVKALEGAVKEVKDVAQSKSFGMPEQAEQPAGKPADAPAVSQAPAEEGHSRIARFTLEAKPDEKFLLTLYPRLPGDKVGQYPEIKFTSNRDDMWSILGAEWQDGWKLPVDKECDWLADWKLGREKTGPKAKPGSRYKDLVALHGA